MRKEKKKPLIVRRLSMAVGAIVAKAIAAKAIVSIAAAAIIRTGQQ